MTKVDKFNKAIKNIIDNTDTKVISKKNLFRSAMRGKNIIAIPLTVTQSWLECKIIIREKSQLESWNVEFSDSAIDSLLLDFIFKNIHEPKYDLQKSVKLWFEELKNSKIVTYIIFRPVYYLITDHLLDFGKVKILKISESVIAEYHPTPEIEYFTPKKIADDLITESKTDIFAIVEVDAKDKEHAEILSQQYLEKALNVIRIFHTGTKITSVENYCPPINVPHFSIVKNTDEFTDGGGNLHLDVPTQITVASISNLQPTWDKIISFLFKNLTNEIESQILTALYWYGEGYKDPNSASSFLKFVTALENLVIFDKQYDKANRIGDRVSSIIYPEGEDREKARAYMKKYYEIRNDVIHAGKTRAYAEDVEQVRLWTQIILQKFIRKHDTYSKMSELFEKEYVITSVNKNKFIQFKKILPIFKHIILRS